MKVGYKVITTSVFYSDIYKALRCIHTNTEYYGLGKVYVARKGKK